MIMKHVLIMILLFNVISTTSIYAEEMLAHIRALTAQVRDPSVVVERTTLTEIALVTYEVLANVPFIGLQDSQPKIEALIGLKNALASHPGVLERMLMVRMQEALDRSLFFESARRAIHLMGRSVTPPYKEYPRIPERIITLLATNALVEQEQIQYLRTLHGTFAQFCRSKNFRPEDFLSGEAIRSFSPDLKASLERMQPMLEAMIWEMDKTTLEDILFVSILTTIDRGKDVRVVCDIYLYDSPPTSWEIFSQQIEQRLTLHPYVRISNGLKSTANDVYATADKYFDRKEQDYPIMLTLFFLPFLPETETILTKIDTILFQYTGEHGQFERLQFPPGAWLTLKD